MSWGAIAVGTIGAVVSYGQAGRNRADARIAAKEAKTARDAAKAQLDKEKEAYKAIKLKNVYADMENPYEDLTVNQQQAQFEAQQQQQGLANTLGSMQGAAGGSGIAALAQAMAGQQSANLQQASASIGQQEAATQMAAAKGAQRTQEMIYSGAQEARGLAQDKQTQLLGMAKERKCAADQARADATQAIVGGVGEFFGAGTTAAAGGAFGDIG